MAQETIADSDIHAAAMRAAAGIGWRRTRLADIAEEAGLSLAELHARFTSKNAVLDGLFRHVDGIVLEGAQKTADEDTSHRDRLFDILMQRFDALNPYKDGIRAVVRDAGSGGVADILCGGCRLLRSMRWMLEAAGISTTGWLGGLRVKGLAVVFGATVQVWLRDDSEDMAKTMAALDRNLKRAEQFATMRSPFDRRRRDEDPGDLDVPDVNPGAAPAT